MKKGNYMTRFVNFEAKIGKRGVYQKKEFKEEPFVKKRRSIHMPRGNRKELKRKNN